METSHSWTLLRINKLQGGLTYNVEVGFFKEKCPVLIGLRSYTHTHAMSGGHMFKDKNGESG